MEHDDNQLTDIRAPQSVQVTIRADGKVLWVDVDGACRLRCCKIGRFEIDDLREEANDYDV